MPLPLQILDLFFPPKCPYCQHLLENPRAPLCPDCQKKLTWLTGKEGERPIDFTGGCFSPLAYRDPVPDAIHRYKFGRVLAYRNPFGLLMAQCLQDHLPQGADLIVWCPLSKQRLRQRGFDQAELLARTVGAQLSIPVLSALKKVRNTAPQSSIEKDSGRRANALGAYAAIPGLNLNGKRIVLVDDVVTSGSTISECAKLLLREGAEQVYGLTLAQARRDNSSESENTPENCKKK